MKRKERVYRVSVVALVVWICGLGQTPGAMAVESITNIHLSPASPATLLPGEHVNITFDYATAEPGGVRIFARPITNGMSTPGYVAHSSPLYPAGAGNGTGYFRIPYGNVVVDQIRFRMYNSDQSSLLLEFFISVRYRYCDGFCIWHVDADASSPHTGSSWSRAFNHLQDALAVAEAGDQILVAEGTYTPDQGNGQTPGDRESTFRLKDGVTIQGGYAGSGEPDPNMRDVDQYVTLLSGDLQGNDGPGFANTADNCYHVVTSIIGGNRAILDGFTITAGHAVGMNPTGQGGGMYIGSGSPSVINCTFVRNKAGRGGAVSNSNYMADDPSFISCKFLGNMASVGGGMESQGGAPTLTNCVFSGNIATGSGGAIFNMGHSEATLTNCTLAGNSSGGPGGGIYSSWDTASVRVLNCIVWNNEDAGGVDESAQVHVSDSTVDIDYSCVHDWSGGLGGAGNIGDDPCFVDADGGDGIPGTEDDNLRLVLGSPCIDAGHPGPEYQDPDGSRNDMGAYGGPSADLTGGGGFAGSGFVFTTIGNIPAAFITQGGGDPSMLMGTANVSPSQAEEHSIPAYTNTAFGSTLWVHGLFGNDDDVAYYQVLVGAWDGDTPPAEEDFEPVDDKLYKVLYTYDLGTGEWNHESVKIGPHTVDGAENLYLLTRAGFWSHIDVLCIWNTRQHSDGKYTLKCKAYDGVLTDTTPPNAAELVLYIDNSRVTAVIHNVKYDPGSPNYDPISDGAVPECGIINLTNDTENLRFEITASHPNGYLRSYILDNIAGKNDHRGVIAQDSYLPTPDALWYGVTDQEFESDDAPDPPGNLEPWKRCAYQFRLRAYARVTNGYHYVYWAAFSDHYFLDLGPAAGCLAADLDHSGEVNFGDLSILAHHWLESCGP